MNLFDIIGGIKRKAIMGEYALLNRKSRFALQSMKFEQKQKFKNLSEEFDKIYKKLNEYDINQFVLQPWHKFNIEVLDALLPHPPFNFLTLPVIMRTMFVTAGGKWLKEELSLLEEKYSKNQLQEILTEEYVGEPFLLNFRYLTSHNSIHHLYHLARFLEATKCSIDSLRFVVEWGGGYGNMAKVFKRLTKDFSSTYVIIDTPIFSCLQWLYLATIFGKEEVNLIQDATNNIQTGKINLLPLCFLTRNEICADIFISTWGLSESSAFAQDYVTSRNWFGARNLLLAYQASSKEFPAADRVGKIATTQGATIEKIQFLRGNYYAFK
jgi:hypothetical protein